MDSVNTVVLWREGFNDSDTDIITSEIDPSSAKKNDDGDENVGASVDASGDSWKTESCRPLLTLEEIEVITKKEQYRRWVFVHIGFVCLIALFGVGCLICAIVFTATFLEDEGHGRSRPVRIEDWCRAPVN